MSTSTVTRRTLLTSSAAAAGAIALGRPASAGATADAWVPPLERLSSSINAPSITVLGPNMQPCSSQALWGGNVLAVIFSLNCPNCIVDLSTLPKLVEGFKSSGASITVMPISFHWNGEPRFDKIVNEPFDPPNNAAIAERIKESFTKYGLTSLFPFYVTGSQPDQNGIVNALDLNQRGIPAVAAISQNRIVANVIGAYHWNTEEARRKVMSVFRTPPTATLTPAPTSPLAIAGNFPLIQSARLH